MKLKWKVEKSNLSDVECDNVKVLSNFLRLSYQRGQKNWLINFLSNVWYFYNGIKKHAGR